LSCDYICKNLKKEIMPSDKGFGNSRNKGPKHGVTYDLRAGRAERKAKRKAARLAKKAAIASTPGATGLERRLNYKGVKARARKADKAAVKKASSVTPEQRKTNQAKATSAHNKRLADATAKYGGEKKKTTPVKTKRGTGKTYKMAWEGMDAKKKAGFKNYADFESKAKAYNRAKDSQKASTGVMKSDANKKKPAGPKNKK
jgi:hypothetical protein